MSKRILILVISLIGHHIWADGFTVSHSDCRLRIKNFTEKNDFLKSLFLKSLKERGYKTEYLVDNKRLIVGDMYLNLEVTRPDKVTRMKKVDDKMVETKIDPLYNPCIVKLEMKEAKGNTINSSDKTLFSKEVERGFPRVTFKGNERCTRALKDAFVHIPNCLKE